ncbi:ceramide kinase family protein isoform X2 [Chelmon rostratus]|uniref:ceramide kinase family protein isoform X2 n=1 Tax=Chelmon rostratus TaxID=109905 RepID=UPI001BE8F168|nr:ceramide kinase family protein isoform X2 [Chelmon rostratus]XP_041802599.1 ceramide kinase family protein isoform X2 [Chelmon rostratus]
MDDSIIFFRCASEPNCRTHPFHSGQFACHISVPVAEVVGVEEGRVEVLPQKSVEDTDKDFTVFYVKRCSSGGSYGLLWRLGRTQFSCPSRALREQWTTYLRAALKTHSPLRPHRLLVFINPFGGKKKGRKIFHSLVAPLFELAGISSHVIVTERANQARDHLLKKDLTGFDGVVCVGGDGMFSEILHGLIGRTQQEAGLCENDPAVTLQPCPLHIGIIPAGSTDCVCYATVGVIDPVTSALHIIIGDSQPLDVCSVHQASALVRYSVSLLGYGFYGDVMAESEKHRWMGPLRYDYSGTMVYLSNRSYAGIVQYLPADPVLSSPRDRTRCLSGCSVCSRSTERLFPHSSDSGSLYSSHNSQFSSDSEGKGDWVTVEGRFRCVSLTCMSSSCPKSPLGLSPSAHLADGTGDLILVWDSHPLGFLKFLYRHTSTQDQFDLPFVEVHRVKAVRFSLPSGKDEEGYEEIRGRNGRTDEEESDYVETMSRNGSQQHLAERPTGREMTSEQKTAPPFLCCMCCRKAPAVSVWNCDGEILPFTDVFCRIHGQLVRLFARGIEDRAAADNCSENDKCKRTSYTNSLSP